MPSASVASSSSKAMSPPLFLSDFDSELFEILFEANLLQFYHNFSVDLKIYSLSDLRNLTDSELENTGLNSVEIRRLRRLVKKEGSHRSFFRLRKKFSFRVPSRVSFVDATGGGDRLSLFNPSHSGSQDDTASSIFRSSSSTAGSLRHSARHLSLTRCGPAPPLVALLDPDLVTLIPTKILGDGEFATVYQGVLRKDALTPDRDGMVGCMGLSTSLPQSQYRALSEFATVKFGEKSSKLLTVAVKKFAPNCLGRPLHVFLQHIALLSDLRHPNLLHIFGCYTDEYCQPALVCELASLRSLIDVFSDPELRVAITPMHLCRFAEQIASAMAYLEKRRVVHGDLACRNVMLSNTSINGQVKVADFGLLRALGVLLSGNGSGICGTTQTQTPPSSSANSDDASTSTDHSKLRLPVAWCAPETLRAVEMSSSSDIWSYGVTLWEMFSYGEQPWSQLSATEILDAVDAPCGQRLSQPDFCPRDYYEDIMLRCWRHDAADRPTFAYLEQHMPLVRPDQVQTIKDSAVTTEVDFGPLLSYSKGEIITVLDKRLKSAGKQTFWKGVTSDGSLGYFCASDVVFYTDLLVPSSGGESATLRIAPTPPLQTLSKQQSLPSPAVEVFQADKSSKKHSENAKTSSGKMPSKQGHKLGGVIPSISSKVIDSSMISLPRGDLRHIGHIGFDGAVSGHVDFIAPGIERVTIGGNVPNTTNNAAPRMSNQMIDTSSLTLKRSDSFEDGFTLPDLSLENEMQEIISTIRLSDFLIQAHSEIGNKPELMMTKASSTNSFGSPSKSAITVQTDSSNMRQPRQPSGFLYGVDASSPPPTLLCVKTLSCSSENNKTHAFESTTDTKMQPRNEAVSTVIVESPGHGYKELEITASENLSKNYHETSFSEPFSPRTTTLSPLGAESESSRSTASEINSSPQPTSSIATSSPTMMPSELDGGNSHSQKNEFSTGTAISSWRYVDSPQGDGPVETTTKLQNKAASPTPQQQEIRAAVSSTTPVGTYQNANQAGQRRASIVTVEERQRVYDEVRLKCGHPLLMSDCLRAVSYTQGNIDAAVKFLKLQYLASHRVAEVERCKNALVACDWDVERALEMLRFRSNDSVQHTAGYVSSSPSDAVNV